MHNWGRYPFSKMVKKLTKNAVRNMAVCCGAIWRRTEKPQYSCTITSLSCTKVQRYFGIFYFLYDFWCAQTCSFLFWTTYTNFHPWNERWKPAGYTQLQKLICITLLNEEIFWRMYINDTLCISYLKQPSICILETLYTETKRYLLFNF